MDGKAKVGTNMRNDASKREITFLYVMRQMREEMDLAWRDFFEKNPDKKEEDVRRRIEERLRSNQDSNDQDKGAYESKEPQEVATQCKADDFPPKGQ